MALVLADRVQQTGTANTTVSFTLSGSVAGFQSFAVIGNGNTTFYSATDSSGDWEVGIGTYSTTGPTLTRTTILSSSNSGSAVTFSGAVNVFVTYPSEKSVNLDGSGNVSSLGTVTSGTWQGSTVGTAYGGTGVTTSTGANSNVLRDANVNITANNTFNSFTQTTAAAGTTVLTAASSFYQRLVASGSNGQTFQLPDATTVPTGATYIFDNDSGGTLTIQDHTGGAIDTVPPGGVDYIYSMANGTVAGTWGQYAFIPDTFDFNTSTASFGGANITNAVWNGTAVAYNYGGTGLTTFAAANYALYSTSATTLTAGTLPIAAGGTGQTTQSAAFNALSPITTTGDLIIGNGTNSATRLGIGTNGYVLTSNGTTASWASLPASVSLSVANTWTATQTFSGSSSTFATSLLNASETFYTISAAPSSSQTIYINNGSVQYFTSNAANNWTLNIAFSSGTSLNTALATGQAMTVAVVTTQGSTAYYNSAVQIDGTSVTPKWQGGAPSAGNASGLDVYTYTIIKTGSATYTVLASLVQFK